MHCPLEVTTDRRWGAIRDKGICRVHELSNYDCKKLAMPSTSLIQNKPLLLLLPLLPLLPCLVLFIASLFPGNSFARRDAGRMPAQDKASKAVIGRRTAALDTRLALKPEVLPWITGRPPGGEAAGSAGSWADPKPARHLALEARMARKARLSFPG